MAPNSSSNAKTLAIACLVLATVGQAETVTKRLFLPVGGYDQVSWLASVVGACSDSTTYALRCSGTPTVGSSIAALPTSDPIQSGVIASFTSAVVNECNSNNPPLTITEGPSGYFVATETVTGGATILAENSCAIDGMTSAQCTVSLSVSEGSAHTAGVVPVAYSGDQFPVIDVTITAGAGKIAAATDAVCKSGASSQYVPIGLTAATVLSIIGAIFAL